MEALVFLFATIFIICMAVFTVMGAVQAALVLILVVGFFYIVLAIYFDQAVIIRKGTVYRVDTREKVVAITFDDGPSPIWTPLILGVLKSAGVKATFFMIGLHVERYPDIARRVVEEGHEVGNHSYDHHGIFYYTREELDMEIRQAEEVIKKTTGVAPCYFRPPKAWITTLEKRQVREMGYEVVLWTLNSKDWVMFSAKRILKFLLKKVRPGDILLFHDSGGVFTTEHGNREETIKVLPSLIKVLNDRGYRFVTITELLKLQSKSAH
jgi:peptidoglycan/xylan/chitin deacetylase (PgdA/CDA1 family)